MLKPQDILVLLKFIAIGADTWSYASLGVELGMSPSQLHAAVKRAVASQLAVRRGEKIVPQVRNLEEFLVHGLRYVFPPELGEPTRGIPTGYAAPPLASRFAADGELPPVWPHPEGPVRGVTFSPLYHLAPKAALADSKLYELLALADAIRGGRARERDMAIKVLKERLNSYGKTANS